MKSYTNIEQSEKLSEILPLKSADMGWNVFVDGSTRALPIEDWDLVKDGSNKVKFYPCWSLAALLDLLPSRFLYENHMWYLYIDKFINDNNCQEYVIEYYVIEECGGDIVVKCNDFVDACYEMIMQLKERNML